MGRNTTPMYTNPLKSYGCAIYMFLMNLVVTFEVLSMICIKFKFVSVVKLPTKKGNIEYHSHYSSNIRPYGAYRCSLIKFLRNRWHCEVNSSFNRKKAQTSYKRTLHFARQVRGKVSVAPSSFRITSTCHVAPKFNIIPSSLIDHSTNKMAIGCLHRPDSPTLASDTCLPDSPTLASQRLSFTTTEQSESSSRSPSPLEKVAKRNPRRTASVLGGFLWSKEGAKPIPKVERLKLVYEEEIDSSSLRSYESTIKGDLLSSKPKQSQDHGQSFNDSESSSSSHDPMRTQMKFDSSDDCWDSNNSRATSRTISRQQSSEIIATPPQLQPTKSRSIIKKPSFLRLSERKASTITSISLLGSPPPTPTDFLYSPVRREDITLDARFRIKQAILKAKHRALENLERPYLDLPPIPLKQWEAQDKLDEGEELQHSIAAAWTQLSVEIGFTAKSNKNTKKIDWHKKNNRFAPLRFSVALSKPPPKRSTPEMMAEIERKDPDGKLRRYKHIVKALRIEKTKELYRSDIVELLKMEAKEKNQKLGFDPDHDYDAPFIKFKGKVPDSKPTMVELVHMFTPVLDGIHIPPGRHATKKNPFASLYRGHLTVEEYENDDLDHQPTGTRRKSDASAMSPTVVAIDLTKPQQSRNLSIRFSAHKATQEFLREIYRETEEGRSAADVSRDVLDMFLEKWCEGNDIRIDEPLALEARDGDGNVVCDLDQYHYIVAYLTRWTEMCETNRW